MQLPSVRIFLVDDQTLVRAGLRMLLGSQPGIDIVGEAGNCDEACAGVVQKQPDVVLLEVDMHSDDGLDVLSTVLQAAPAAGVILLTRLNDPEVHERAVRSGAAGVVLKRHHLDELLQAIHKVHQGEVWLNGELLARLLRPAKLSTEPSSVVKLTERERAVIALLCEGLQNKEIARRLHVSEVTVRHRLTALYHRFNVTSRLDLAMFAHRNGLCNAD